MKKFLIFMLLPGFLLMSACSNTLEGIGKDMQKLGKSIEDATDR